MVSRFQTGCCRKVADRVPGILHEIARDGRGRSAAITFYNSMQARLLSAGDPDHAELNQYH
jgi:hypothetical protein